MNYLKKIIIYLNLYFWELLVPFNIINVFNDDNINIFDKYNVNIDFNNGKVTGLFKYYENHLSLYTCFSLSEYQSMKKKNIISALDYLETFFAEFIAI